MKKILVIEDTLEVRENICEILELDGYEVYAASHGKEGVEKAIKKLPDLILCDIMMPELDGFGVLKILNKNRKTHHIPFIFLTAKAERSDFRKGMGLGADDYITKPFDDTELLEAIEMRLKKSETASISFDGTEESLQRFFSEAKAKEELELLTENRELRYYKKKDVIYSHESRPHWLFFLVSGSVKCFQTNEFGKELITHIYKKGEFFGYHALITESPYIDSCVALEATTLRLIPREDFKLLLFNNRDFAAQFIKMISNQVEETEQNLLELAYSSVRRKVAMALLSFDSVTDEDNIVDISREDLASKAGTAKETLIRTLSEFKSEGLITVESGLITILNERGLRSMPQ